MSAIRTPPSRRSAAVLQVSSENDIASLNPDSPTSFVSRRSKRPRDDSDVNTGDLSLKEELLAMLTKWKTDQDAVLNKLCSDIGELKKQNTSIQATSDELERSIKFMSSQYEDIKGRLLEMERERKENLSYISSLENKIDDMQKKLKSTVIEFRNLPQEVKHETQQDLCEVVQKTCNAFNTTLQCSEIKDIYRITTKSGMSTVITDLTSALSKNKILYGIKEFNQKNPNNKLSSLSIGTPGPAIPIYISESLTNKDRKLYSMARDAAKSLEYKYCWTKRGNIFMKKNDGGARLIIRNEGDLSKLKKD